MLFLMLCVLPTGFICHTVTAFHDKVTNCIRTKESVCLTVFFFIAGEIRLFPQLSLTCGILEIQIAKRASVWRYRANARESILRQIRNRFWDCFKLRKKKKKYTEKTRYQHVRVRYIHTEDCFFHISMFFRCALVKWSQTFLWLAAVKTRSIWLTVDDMVACCIQKNTTNPPLYTFCLIL